MREMKPYSRRVGSTFELLLSLMGVKAPFQECPDEERSDGRSGICLDFEFQSSHYSAILK